MREDPARDAWVLMWQLGMRNRHRLVEAAEALGLGMMHGQVLHLLDEQGPLRMSDVAERLHCDASNVTGLVDRLEGRGLVERRAHEHDRRVKLLAVTPAGRALHARFHERIAEPPEEITALPRADQRTLRDILRRATAG